MRLLACLALVALLGPLRAVGDDELGVGLPAPSFTLPTMNASAAGSTRVSLYDYVGPEAEDPGSKIVVLSFFASWCGPCQKEIPFLVRLDREYREKGLRVVAVNIDREPSGIDKAKAQVLAAGVRYPVLSDRFNITTLRYLGEKAPLPSVFLIARDGNVLRVERGYTKDASSLVLMEVRNRLGVAAGVPVPKVEGVSLKE